ncbi:YcjF family protein [Pseudanabaena sp. PCC 6802]|uniref:YcjF family protein n=1 Tax=Pseudanabaena sp. PCC 6802 TaxID=118173 RepID=UPI000349FB34|nr:GTP-binding protein [Pseudanabaena sp. PCC 6802]
MFNSGAWRHPGLFLLFVISVMAIAASTLTNLLSDWQVIGGAVVLCSMWLLVKNRQLPQPSDRSAPQTPVDRHSLQRDLQKANQLIAKIGDLSDRQVLEKQAEQIANNLAQNQFRIAVFGMGSTGKTAVINALMGRKVGNIAATVGTTPATEIYDYGNEHREDRGNSKSALLGKKTRQISLIDTPGIQEMGGNGQVREAEALHVARTSDLLVFVTSGDLSATEYQALTNLCRVGKRTILAFNKTDSYLPKDREAIITNLRHHAQELVLAEDIVAIAAQPAPIKVRQYGDMEPDRFREWLEPIAPEIAPLKQRIEAILSGEWEELLIANTHQQIQALLEETQAKLKQLRHAKAEKIVMRFQAIAATTVFANPLPGLDLVANTAINVQMLIELSRLYERSFSVKQAQKAAAVIAQSFVQMGCVELATTAIANCLKTNAITYAIGGSVQALSAAYLIRVGGLSFVDYLDTLEESSTQKDMANTLSTLRELCQKNFSNAQSAQFLTSFVGSAVKQINHGLHIAASSS